MNGRELDILEKVGRFGWMVMQVGPLDASSEPREWFAYTIGLRKTFDWPELVCFNLDLDVMKTLLSNAVAECGRAQRPPTAGLILNDVVNGSKAKLVSFSDRDWKPRLTWAIWYSDHFKLPRDQFDCLQLLWPDKAGRFSDDPLCDSAVRKSQTPVSQFTLR